MEIHHRVKNNLQVITSLLPWRPGAVTALPKRCSKTCRSVFGPWPLLHETIIYRRGSFVAIDLGA
ncbi:MAG: hypothetical protein IPH54_22320 [Rhodoferax sp.]|nr:hypothetical protein [Rhodoferax sp.]